MEQKKLPDALRINRNRCILAIVVCSILCFLVFLAVTDQLLRDPDVLIKEVGWKAYHMFTVLSNILMAVAAAMCIPFAVDGMRYRNYHLPRWYVNLMYMGTTGVAITFLIALTVLAPAAGFYRVMLFSNNILFHLTCPILSILLFFLINSDHRIKWQSTFIAIIPVVLYALTYVLMVFVIGEEAGGWRDHYQIYRIAEYLPLPVILLILCLISFGIATVLRLVHNAIHKKRKADMERYYQQAEAFSYPDLETAIGALADLDRPYDMGGELTVPRRIMNIMERKYQSGLSTKEMCIRYIEDYFKDEE
ncbi:MAG: hypothetical protein II918_05290 [Firmicutes bacterium]|nr:hypothetical protein [Clostridia bacterium]MBQ4467613.1 hypothetical protein [Bacillota bacterium]